MTAVTESLSAVSGEFVSGFRRFVTSEAATELAVKAVRGKIFDVQRARTKCAQNLSSSNRNPRASTIKLARLIQTYAGDPALSQRCAVLLVNLDKEVQEPPKIAMSRKGQVSQKNADPVKRPVRAAAGRSKPATAEKSPARQRDRVAKHAKPLVKEIGISRRRARR